MKNIIAYVVLSVIVLIPTQAFSQDEQNKTNNLNFFLDCHDCDFDFVRQELDFISFVRDPKLADVHILSSKSRTGSGGTKYFLNFIGLKNLEGQNLEYEYFSEQSETDDETRKGLLKILKTGILHYYAKTDFFNQLEIQLEAKDNRNAIELVNDPWNLWVIKISAGTDFEFEEQQNEFSLGTELSIEKVTEAWKTEFEGNYQTDKETYYDDDEEIENNQNEVEITAEFIKSLNPRWSAGVFGEYSSRTYLNIKNAYEFAAGAEYNIFPWDKSNRKVFAFRYQAGIKAYDYNEETIYGKLSETLLYESLGLNLRLVQPWGDVEMRLEGRHYFHDFSKNRLTLESQLSIRLTKQLSVYFELESRVIHDQLYLPKGDASLEDILLKRRKLATTYEVSGEVGLRFTFGSIYNNVVNERF